jgi:hypothetical protein
MVEFARADGGLSTFAARRWTPRPSSGATRLTRGVVLCSRRERRVLMAHTFQASSRKRVSPELAVRRVGGLERTRLPSSRLRPLPDPTLPACGIAARAGILGAQGSGACGEALSRGAHGAFLRSLTVTNAGDSPTVTLAVPKIAVGMPFTAASSASHRLTAETVRPSRTSTPRTPCTAAARAQSRSRRRACRPARRALPVPLARG